MSAQVLFVDFSADNSVRMTLAEPGKRPPGSQLYHCDSLGELDGAIGDYLGERDNPGLVAAALSVCGWERDGAFEMPNHSYRIERAWIKERLNISRLHLINDCVASALAIDRLDGAERRVIWQGQDEPTQMKAMIAIGRSLGTTCLVTDELGQSTAFPCAGGHTDLPATTEREIGIVRLILKKYSHVSRVRAVSTAGLVEVYSGLKMLDGVEAGKVTPMQVVELARAGEAHAREAVDMVVGWLAGTASDTALCVGARGGIYLAGSFFDVLGDLFDPAAFARRFTDKGRLSGYMQDISVYLVKTQEPEMIGLSTLFG